VDPRLQQAIGTARIQTQASELVRLALLALADLKRLDESLYERFVASVHAPEDASASMASLQRLWETTFRGVLLLLAFCRRLVGDRQVPVGDTTEIELDFDMEDAGSQTKKPEDALDLDGLDIGDLLDGIDAQNHVQGDAERWSEVLDKLASIEYGLRSQYATAASRLAVALQLGNINEVLALLDDTQSSASEGVHAAVAAVYEAFVPSADPSTIVPGYLTALGRALLVRRGLMELASTLGPWNDMLQGPDATRRELALEEIRGTMHTFVESEVCRSMRAADRWQLVQFEQELRDEPTAAARHTSEGLVKYLESLGSVNQREVLLRHDERMLDQMRESLANARQLIDLSPRTANEMLHVAYQSALQLRGRHPATDALVIGLERYATMSAQRTENLRFLERLEAMLAAAGG
jgi:hypothetical protein